MKEFCARCLKEEVDVGVKWSPDGDPLFVCRKCAEEFEVEWAVDVERYDLEYMHKPKDRKPPPAPIFENINPAGLE